MSIWTRISEALSALSRGEPLGAVFERLRTEPDRSVAFAIAVIALGAKIAKADGLVTRDEVSAFREVFHIPTDEEANAARVFNLARQDIAGFDEYARKIKAMFGEVQAPLRDLLEGLFHIAMADGEFHPAENAFLEEVATIFGFDERTFLQMRAQFVPDAERDPYSVLGVDPAMTLLDIRTVWRAGVRKTHPDSLAARGLPKEAIKMAEKRLIAINAAWEQIQRAHVAV
ncbi:MAG: molecular chaperone DjiA [Rhodobacteraceae bacterium]|nr:molecular chaperone DjiA [Paracoccaceae bacterium]